MRRIPVVSILVGVFVLVLITVNSAMAQNALLTPLISFGTVNTGSSSTNIVTLTNNGNATATISQVSTTGAGFSVSGLSTPYTLATGAATSFKVSFSPSAAGAYSESVAVTSNAANSPTTVSLSGTGASTTSGPA